MLKLDQCIGANRPLTFVVAESDVEVLQYINTHFTKDNWSVYSATLGGLIPLKDLLMQSSAFKANPRFLSTTDVLESILSRTFDPSDEKFEKYIFLDAQMYLVDPQVVRKMKDIVSRYQLNSEFTVNLICITQTVHVPTPLERLSEVVFFDLPDEKELAALSDTLAHSLELDVKEKGKESRMPSEEVINNLKGLTLFEVEQAYLQSLKTHDCIHLGFIRDFKKNSISKTDLLSLMENDISFDNIGGMNNLKQWIKKSYGGWTVEGKKFGLPILKGVLLVGPPGTGKSLVAKSVGNEWGLPVVQFDPSRIFSSRVGDSETNMRRVLKIIENMSPCVLFIDEIEKGLAGMQSSTFSDSGVTARVIGSFLIWMQDCNKPVFTVATANAIQYLPPELISRFDETFFVNIPSNSERRDIFKIHVEKLGKDSKTFDLELLAKNSVDLCGREIEQVLRESMYNAFHQKKELSTEVVVEALSKKTNILTTMSEQIKYLLDWVGYDEKREDGLRARFASKPDTLDIDRVKNEINNILNDIEKKKPFQE